MNKSNIEHPIYIVGHQNPDTDSIVSAYVYAWLLDNKNPSSKAEPLRLGEVNPQTAWLFEQVKLPLPKLKTDCRLRVMDVQVPAITVNPEDPLSSALEKIQECQCDVVAVIDDDEKVMGIITDRLPSTNYLLRCNIEDFLGTVLQFEHLVKGLNLLHLNNIDMHIVPSRIVLGASSPDKMEKKLEHGDILIVSDYPELISLASKCQCSGIIIGGLSKKAATKLSEFCDLPIYFYSGSIPSILSKLTGCFPCSAAIEEKFTWVDEQHSLSEIHSLISKFNHGLLVLDDNLKLTGYISHKSLLGAKKPKLILVDHFESSQSIDGLDEAEVIEIIDHHRIGDIETSLPVAINCKPWGSTATIIYDQIQRYNFKPPVEIATLLLGAIISDTILLNSPTTTNVDINSAKELAEIAKLNLSEFGLTVLKMNDQLVTAEPRKLLNTDCKNYKSGDIRFIVSQIETVDLSQLDDKRKESLTDVFTNQVYREGVSFGVFMVTNVIEHNSFVKIVGEDEKLIKRLLPDDKTITANSWIAEKWVSRKKQAIPYFLDTIKKKF